MATAGYSGTPLPKKLGIKEGHVVGLFAPPRDFDDTLGDLPAGVRLRRNPRGRGPYDVLVIFAQDEEKLEARFDRARAVMTTSGGLWVAWPKQSSPLATELKESHVRAYGLSTGLVDNKICAIDQDWSGLRFVVRVADRPGKG